MDITVLAAAADEFPFQFRDGFLWVEVSVAGEGKPLHFLLDTGAGVSVIDQRAADELGLPRRGRGRVTVRGVQTATIGFWPQRLSGKVGSVSLPRNFLALDLSRLGRACARPVDGLLGADFFRGRIVQIDFRRQTIRLLTPGQGRRLEGESLALDVRRCGLRVPVGVNGGPPQWLRLDTGCAAPLHWVTSSIEPQHRQPQLAIGLAEVTLLTATVSAQLGSTRFDPVAAVIHEREIFAGEAGLLGTGLLSQFTQVTVDTKAKRLILTK